ncbi:MAG: PQQ-dependent sugar dehydrogenase [Dehalococcoidia bacterium]
MSLRLASTPLIFASAIGALLVAALSPNADAGVVPVSFTYGELPASIAEPTSLAFGPDGRLYVATTTDIHALTLTADSVGVVDDETIATDLSWVLGIAFDPTSPASPVTIYASHQDPGATLGFNGAVSKFTGPDWTRVPVVTGLPTSNQNPTGQITYNHMTNGIAFDASGKLFIAQGSASDGGLPIPYFHETPLSAAILSADIHAPGFDGAITYDPPGPPADFNVDQVSGDVSVYAPGMRNPYDLVLHTNGHMYATDNGAMGQQTSLTCATQGGPTSTSDKLNLVVEGDYYGFPNRNRGRTDPRQCTYHPPSEPSSEFYTAPLVILPNHCSCDGLAEYTSDAFGGQMQGDLIYAEWSSGRISRLRLADGGESYLDNPTPLSSAFAAPLDVVVAPNGMIYVAEYSGNVVSYLAPEGSPATPTPGSTATATPGAGLVGDVNCDGVVNSIDAAFVLQFTAGLFLPLPCAGAADVDESGSIDAIDAALILQLEAGLIDHLPP